MIVETILATLAKIAIVASVFSAIISIVLVIQTAVHVEVSPRLERCAGYALLFSEVCIAIGAVALLIHLFV